MRFNYNCRHYTAYKSTKQCAALMAHEYFELWAMSVPPQKYLNSPFKSAFMLNATANGNLSSD
ncbi:CLUMA_CG007145, isoform A [Clunio marinus]|uniref:CLUMA_CG007145, isoform A n=1 Tax=Clunio marinus TaxID=568069 RepID=A0A1J1HZS8_9DIPT|nr:CLUMA_CG007145, isoform A [Clunio marinus]